MKKKFQLALGWALIVLCFLCLVPDSQAFVRIIKGQLPRHYWDLRKQPVAWPPLSEQTQDAEGGRFIQIGINDGTHDARNRHPVGDRPSAGPNGKKEPQKAPVLKQGQCLLFYHIPKTGGSTILQEVNAWIPNQKSNFFRWYTTQGGLRQKLANMSATRTRPILWTGHFGGQMGDLLVEAGLYSNRSQCFQFTSLRHPVEKVISGYYYMKVSDLPKGDWYSCLNGPWQPSKSGAGSRCIQFDNDDVRRFSGQSDVDGYDTVAVMEKIPFHRVTPHHLQLAMRRLNDLDAVLITEFMDESFQLLACRFNLSASYVPAVAPHKNVGRKREEVPDDVIALIEKNNQLDLALYHHARILFAQQLRQCNIAVSPTLLSPHSSMSFGAPSSL